MGAFKDLTGMKIGKLTIIKRGPNKSQGRESVTTWKCLCICGATTIKSVIQLWHDQKPGKVASCGCHKYLSKKFVDLTGAKIGKLTVLSREDDVLKSGKPSTTWKCVCECGKEKIFGVNYFNQVKRHKRTASCGCDKIDKMKKRMSLPPGENGVNILWSRYRSSAKNRKLDFTLTKTEFRILTENNCQYCGKPPERREYSWFGGRWKVNHTFNGIDRIDNKKGYTQTNCASCCTDCNRAKLVLTREEYISHCRRVVEHNTKGSHAFSS